MTYKKPEDLIGENGLLKELPTLLGERVLDAEQAEHLGREYHEVVADAGGNIRNGMDKKTHKGRFGGQRAHQDGAVGATADPGMVWTTAAAGAQGCPGAV